MSNVCSCTSLHALCRSREASLIFKVRALIVSISIVVFILVIYIANVWYQPASYPWLVLADYGLWILFTITLLAGLLDMLCCFSRYLLSMYAVTVVGVILAVIGRFASLLQSLLDSSFYTPIVGGGLVGRESYKWASLVIAGSVLVLASTLVATLLRGHVVFSERVTVDGVLRLLKRIEGGIKAGSILAASFMVGFLLRLYPETLYELPIGWDTIEYVSNALDFAQNPKIITTYTWLGDLRNIPPLLTYISGGLAIAGLSPFIFFKIWPPIATGAISLLAAAITLRLTRSRLAALLSAIAVAFNPWILGQTQQWQRHVLGLVLLMLYIYIALSDKPRNAVKVALLILMATAYEQTCLLAVVISIVEALRGGMRERILYTATLVFSLLLLIFYTGFPSKPVVALTPLGPWIAGSTISMGGLGHAIQALLVLALFTPAIFMLRSVDIVVKVIFIAIFVFAFSPMLFTITIALPYRWLTILITITTPFAVAALYQRGLKIIALLFATLIVIAGVAYVFTKGGYAHFTFLSQAFPHGYPWRLSPAISDTTFCRDTARIVLEEKEALVIMRFTLYPCLHLYIRNFTKAVNLDGEPIALDVIRVMNATKTGTLYVLTWINLTEDLKRTVEEFNSIAELYGLREPWFKLESLKCEELLKDVKTQTTLYKCTIEEHEGVN